MQGMDKYTDKAIELGMTFGPKLLLAIIVLVIGWWFASALVRRLDALLERQQVDKTLHSFLSSLSGVILKALILIITASMIGVETASLIALLGAAGLAIGFALQGSLSNFAGGILILFFKPFKAGDFIEAQGHSGDVQEIQIFNTVLLTKDKRKVVIPNGMLSNGTLVNVFCEPNRRVDLTFGISYSDDIATARAVLEKVIADNDLILKDIAHDIYVSAHADSSINLLVRVWTESANYWAVNFALMEQVKYAFDNAGLTIPFPQRDVHMYSASNA